MKILAVLIMIFISENVTFGQNSYDFLCPELSRLFEQYVQKYPSKKYYVISENRDSSNIVTFGTSDEIPEHFIDYYVIDGKTMITYYSVDSIYDKNVIDTAKMARYDNYLGELSKSTYFSNCIPNSISYIGERGTYKEKRNDTCFGKFNKAVDMNGINSKKLNEVLNSFINTYQNAHVYEIRFFKLKNKLYVSLYWNHFYDLNNIDAYFYRNGRLVVLYGIKQIDSDCKIINHKDIIFYNKGIYRVRCGIRDNWYMPIPSVYIIDKKKIKHIGDNKAFELIGRSLYDE